MPVMNQAPDFIYQLPLPERSRPFIRERTIHNGYFYHIDVPELDAIQLGNLGHNLEYGLIGSYRMTCQTTEMEAINPRTSHERLCIGCRFARSQKVTPV